MIVSDGYFFLKDSFTTFTHIRELVFKKTLPFLYQKKHRKM